jgi:hypothetical protein
VVEQSREGIGAEQAVAWLRALGQPLHSAGAAREKAELRHAIYERVTVVGAETRSLRLTAAAHAHKLELALPEKGCHGAPDRCWARVSNLRNPDRGPR